MPAKRGRSEAPKIRFGTVALVISDLKRSVDWYTKILGLDVVEGTPRAKEHWVVVGRKGVPGGIHLCNIPTFDPDYAVEPGNSGIDLWVPGDFSEACEALEANGVRFVRPVTQRPWGIYAVIADPDGNELRLTPQGKK